MIKLLYIANENMIGDQVGARQAFEIMKREDILQDYRVVSFIFLQKECSSKSQIELELLKAFKEIMPDIVLIEHLGKFNLSNKLLKEFKNIKENIVISYREGDIYKGIVKPISSQIKNIASETDITFLSGDGSYINLFKKIGFNNIKYAPNCVDTIRFGHIKENRNIEFDMIFIGNNIGKRYKVFEMEGNDIRKKYLKLLSETYGNRFCLYGEGWDMIKGSKGRLHFDLQNEAIQLSKMVIGIDHYPSVSKYFSNRLPIAMISGVPYVCYKSKDLDKLFKDRKEIFFFDSEKTLIETVEEVLALSDEERKLIGDNGRKKILDRYTTEKIYKDIVKECKNILK